MPIDDSCVSDFTISGNVTRLVSARLASARHDREFRNRHPVVVQQLLRQRFVAREEHAARIATRVGQPQQLEIADDVLIERPDLVERFQQIEGDVRLEFVVGLPDGGEVVLHAEHLHVVPELVAQRLEDVVLGPPLRGRRHR